MAWWAIAVIAVFQIVSMVDRVLISILIPEMKVDLGLNDFQISLVQGMAFALFYGAIGLVIGGLVDRWSRPRIMFGGIVIWSLAAASTGLARNYVQLFLGRLMVGFGEGAISPAAQSLIATMFARHRLSTPMSCFTAAGVAGSSLSFLIGGMLLAHFTLAPLGGMLAGLAPWRQVLIVTGLPGVLIAFLAFTLPEPRRAESRRPNAARWRDFFNFLGSHPRLMVGMLAGYGLASMATQGMMTWTPTFTRTVLHVDAARTGLMMALAVAGGGIFGTVGFGLLVDFLYRRGVRDASFRIFFVAALICPPLAAIAFLSGNAAFTFASVGLILFTLGASIGPALAAIQMISPPMMRGRLGALAVLVSNLGGFALGPMMVGALTDYAYRDPAMVGTSIATVLILLGPAAAGMIAWARPAFVRRLANISGD